MILKTYIRFYFIAYVVRSDVYYIVLYRCCNCI